MVNGGAIVAKFDLPVYRKAEYLLTVKVSMETVQFKQATTDDWKLAEELEKGSASPLFAPCQGEEGYKRYLRESKEFFILMSEKPIGTISYKPESDKNVIINGLTVLPQYRGKGIATNAMKKLLADLDGKRITLLVHPENTAALLIYLRLGFVITEWKSNHFGDGQPRLYLEKKTA